VDKRFNPLNPSEELQVRRRLSEELAADPALPIPAVIRKIRTALRLTIAEYAKLCGVSARTLQDIEREVSAPTLVTAEKLLKPLGLGVGAVQRRKKTAERA
jgi:DNA-binding transcriptional regulator YiaG